VGLPVLAVSKVDDPVWGLFAVRACFGRGIEVKVFELEEAGLAVSANKGREINKLISKEQGRLTRVSTHRVQIVQASDDMAK
jgi:hypothetical protein